MRPPTGPPDSGSPIWVPVDGDATSILVAFCWPSGALAQYGAYGTIWRIWHHMAHMANRECQLRRRNRVDRNLGHFFYFISGRFYILLTREIWEGLVCLSSNARECKRNTKVDIHSVASRWCPLRRSSTQNRIDIDIHIHIDIDILSYHPSRSTTSTIDPLYQYAQESVYRCSSASNARKMRSLFTNKITLSLMIKGNKYVYDLQK